MEVPCYLPKLLFELNEQRKRDFFCDCSILVEGRVFKAHRNVLFAGSGYFRALLVHYLQVGKAQLICVFLLKTQYIYLNYFQSQFYVIIILIHINML